MSTLKQRPSRRRKPARVRNDQNIPSDREPKGVGTGGSASRTWQALRTIAATLNTLVISSGALHDAAHPE
jgi:hypothetical protein